MWLCNNVHSHATRFYFSFKEKAKCFEDQYSKYSYPDLKLRVDGNLTLGENIADNGGIWAAYKAYSEDINSNSEIQNVKCIYVIQNLGSNVMEGSSSFLVSTSLQSRCFGSVQASCNVANTKTRHWLSF